VIKDIAFVSYPSNSVTATRNWYEKHLGLKFAGPYEEEGVEMYNEAHLGTGAFSLVHEKWAERPAGSGAGCAFEVEDLDKLIANLRASGVSVEDPYQTPVCKMASTKDPEGNTITLHQRTAPPR
jgi:predicted enzyme related to lactoylglutathione lyase